MTPKKILFVDDERIFLDGLRLMLIPMRATWEMHFVTSGGQALEQLALQPYDVLVTDLRMPGINGIDVLHLVNERYPKIVQIILSGYNDDLISKITNPNFQYLTKPCELERLILAVNRACAVRDLLADKQLKMLVSNLSSLPTLPPLYNELVTELQSDNSSIKKIAKIIACDLGMTAKILQLANSALFGLRRHISSPFDAVNLLGIDAVVAMTLTIQLFSRYNRENIRGFSPAQIWNHSLRVGVVAKRIAQFERQDPEVVKDTFTAGLLHDTGELVLAVELPQQFQKMLEVTRDEGHTTTTAERCVFNATHGEIGAFLLGLWGLSDPIIEAVAFHHEPARTLRRNFCPLSAVHIANALVTERPGNFKMTDSNALDLNYLKMLGLDQHLPEFTNICAQSAESETR